jgi:hypothetical protein
VPLNRIEHLDIRAWVGDLIAGGPSPVPLDKRPNTTRSKSNQYPPIQDDRERHRAGDS